MSTVRFNVGGKEYTISTSNVYKSTKLSQLLSARHNEKDVIFLDHNYEAFSVVLDYLRYRQFLIPPTVCRKSVELIFDDLGIHLNDEDRMILASESTYEPHDSRGAPPQYTSTKDNTLLSKSQRTGNTDANNLVNQLLITVQQKISDLVINTIRPRIASQALQGSYHTTYVLLPIDIQDGTMMSEFPSSNFPELVYLDKDTERFLAQPEVQCRFEVALKRSLEVPITFTRRDIFFRSQNEFGILQTATAEAIVIEFELGRQLV
jgi:hypothetical protein